MDSLWVNTIDKNDNFSELNNDLSSDICIIGGGIFGITCGYYLSKLGYKVVILEKDSIGSKTTGNTTGKITSQHDLFYTYLVDSLGENYAKDYFLSNENAIKNIKNIIDIEKIKCDFKTENNYLYTTEESEIDCLKKEFDILKSFGANCDFVNSCKLPFEIQGAICLKNQAQFNPLKYIYGLCDCIKSNNGEIFTNTTVSKVKRNSNDFSIYANEYIVNSKYVIVASHYPFINIPGLYFTKMYQESSYLIAVDTKSDLFPGMYINPSDPVFSYRTAMYKNKKVLLIGGAGHKTGIPSCYEDTYGVLENKAKQLYPNCEILYHWNTRDCISLDKIPYIGRYSNMMSNIFVGTGFKKWGMSLSNVAANIITDQISGKKNDFSYLFSSTRMKPFKNHDEFKNILVQSTNSLFLDKLRPSNMVIDEIKNDSGSIVSIDNKKIGVYKDPSGEIFAVKPMCTHLGCLLSWNDIDKTWDCPCHGSRFDFTGKNIYDPAYKNLEVYNITKKHNN